MSEERVTAEDIRILEGDAISFIRKRPSSFMANDPNGAHFVGRLVQDLMLLDAGPVRVARSGSWYSVSAEKDWLMSEDGVLSLAPFRRFVPMPNAGQNCDRAEVIIAALTDAVVTLGVDGVTWISGESALWPLPGDLDLSPTSQKGRTVAFHFEKSTTSEFSARDKW